MTALDFFARWRVRLGYLLAVVVLWLANVLLFGAWYWIIDAGGPRVRREGPVERYSRLLG